MSLGYVCNIGDGSSINPDDDKIKIRVILKVEEHADSQDANNTKNWVSAGIMFHETKMWVGQCALFAMNITFGDLEYIGVSIITYL